MASKVNKCGENFCPPMLLMCAVPFTHLMLVLNSSANIVIYCLLGDGFRYAELIKQVKYILQRVKNSGLLFSKLEGKSCPLVLFYG